MIAQAFVYGDSLKNNVVAIIFPEEDAVKAWVQKADPSLASKSLSELYETNEFRKVIGDEMASLAKEKKLSSLEKPKVFMLSDDLCTKENDCLTATEKMKRNVVAKKFKD